MASPSRIMLVDDHPIVREGLARLIACEPDLVLAGEAQDPEGALTMMRRDRPDLVVLDLSLSGGNGIDLIRAIGRRHPRVRILVLSIHDEISMVEQALRAGAMGYVSKRNASKAIITAIRALLDGKVYVSRDLSPALLRRLIGGGQARNEA